MQRRDLTDLVHFSSEGPRRETAFETGRLWAEVICLGRNQRVGPLSDPSSDGLFTVLAGEAVFLVDRNRARVTQWGSVLAPAGSQVFVTNASADPAVLFLVTAPPPAAPEG